MCHCWCKNKTETCGETGTEHGRNNESSRLAAVHRLPASSCPVAPPRGCQYYLMSSHVPPLASCVSALCFRRAAGCSQHCDTRTVATMQNTFQFWKMANKNETYFADFLNVLNVLNSPWGRLWAKEEQQQKMLWLWLDGVGRKITMESLVLCSVLMLTHSFNHFFLLIFPKIINLIK